MKVVHIITGLSTGGAEMMLFKLLQRLDRSRFQTHVISLTSVGEMGARVEALGIPVEALGLTPGRLPKPRQFWRLLRRLRELSPDVVQTWMYHADLLGGLAARLAGVRSLVWGIRNGVLSAEQSKRSTILVARVCALLSRCLPERIVVCSDVARQAHEELGYAADKMVVVPNGFDLSRFRFDQAARLDVRRELAIAPEAKLVGLIARFDPQKNHLGFVSAMEQLRQRQSNTHFLLVGQGVDWDNDALAAAIEHAGLRGVCHLLGRREDIPRLMATLDVLASASFGEAFPNVLGEAMACGVPCAVTDAGDSAYIVGDTGRVVAPGDMGALALAIEALLDLREDDRAALGERARARISDLFEIGAVVRRYEAVYDMS